MPSSNPPFSNIRERALSFHDPIKVDLGSSKSRRELLAKKQAELGSI